MPLPVLTNPNSSALPTTDTNNGDGGGLGNMSAGQLQQAFVNPQQENIANAISTGFDRVGSTQANQMAASPLAGITTLGSVAQAGNQAAGLQQAGVQQAGLQQAGVQQAGLAQAGLAQAGQVGINTAPSNALLQGQVSNINALGQQAAGQGPSIATLQANEQGRQNVAAQMAMLASQHGASNSSLGMRQAMQAKAQADQQAIAAGVQGRAAEQLSGQQQLTSALAGTQGQVMQGAQAQAGLTQNTNLANAAAANAVLGQNASLGQQQQITNAQLGSQAQLANAASANSQMQNNAAAANQVGLANMQAGNQVGLANAASANAASLQNAASQNQAMLQQGQMNQQTELSNTQLQAQKALANLQAQQQTQGLNAQDYNAMTQALMASGNNDLTASTNYANALIQQQLVEQGMRNNLSINASNNQTALIGAGIAGGAALGGAAVTAFSDINLKTKITSGDKSIKSFLSQISAPASNFNLMSK